MHTIVADSLFSSCASRSCNPVALVTRTGVEFCERSLTPLMSANSFSSQSSSSLNSLGIFPQSSISGAFPPCRYTSTFPGSNPSSDNSSVSIEPSSTVKTPIERRFKNSCFRLRTALYALCTGISLSMTLLAKNAPGKRRQSCLTKGNVRSPLSPFL